MGSVSTAAIILAAGLGLRIGADRPKAFIHVGDDGVTPLLLSARAAANAEAVDQLVVTVPDGYQDEARATLSKIDKPITVMEGGVLRQDSVRLALQLLAGRAQVVAVHDAARCLATPALFDAVLRPLAQGAVSAQGVIPVMPVTDTIKRVDDGVVIATEPRQHLFVAQTPQAFDAALLRTAHEDAVATGIEFTDDSAVMEWAGHTVITVEGEATNVKMTTASDVEKLRDTKAAR